jgi:hypothetical protein
MFDTTRFCAENPWPNTAAQTYSEFESGFLLPQMMGASLGESASADLRVGAMPCARSSLFASLRALLGRALRFDARAVRSS